MTVTLYWFRNDLRIRDNPAFLRAIDGSDCLLPIYCHDPHGDAETRWGFRRVGAHRRRFLATALDDLGARLRERGSDLIECGGAARDVLPALAAATGATRVVAEQIAAPEEQAELAAMEANGLRVETVWQSSMLDPDDLPFAMRSLPDVFTKFRNVVEKADVLPVPPVGEPSTVPPMPELRDRSLALGRPASIFDSADAAPIADVRSSFPYHQPPFAGGETAALEHLARYCERRLPHTYKQTRNGLSGTDYSSKFSPWLANGALSARTVHAAIKAFETRHGANESTYWLWFELLWRDYFRMLALKYGERLYHARGLSALPPPKHDRFAFKRWCRAETGVDFIDAGMRELAATGYLSNRMRQNVASYLVHDLRCDWRAGAAWFEAQLLDYDVYSNQGNWLYVAGRGTDPRAGRRFDPHKQAGDYDADGAYRKLWSNV